MTHQPLTKAEREELRASMHKWRGGHWLHHEHPIYKAVCDGLPRLLADLDAAEAAMLCKGCGGTVGDHLAPDQGGCPGSFEIDGVQMVPLSGRNEALAQRDRAESELDAERRMRVEAEAAAKRAEEERDALKAKLAALVEAAQVVLDRYGLEIEMGLDVPALRKAIAAARGGAQ